jgi:hypothetical protein
MGFYKNKLKEKRIMCMLKYEVTKDMTPKKIKDAAKEELLNLFIDFLNAEFADCGEDGDPAFMIRTGTTSKKNELCFKFGTVTEGDLEKWLVAVINPTVKEFSPHATAKGKPVEEFDFRAAKREYDEYILNKMQENQRKLEEKEKNAK